MNDAKSIEVYYPAQLWIEVFGDRALVFILRMVWDIGMCNLLVHAIFGEELCVVYVAN